MKKKIFLIILSIPLLLSSCVWKTPKKPSVLVIAVESLKMSDVSCDFPSSWAGDFKSGFEIFCKDSVRFTHAFTPSVMSQSAMSSLLTGLYPYEHGVRHNGSHYLSGHAHSIGEEALSKGFRTAFFSGGPPIWSKGGFRQGFEYFDDRMVFKYKKYFRSTREVFGRFLNWLDKSDSRKPFLSILYLADIQFPDSPAASRKGHGRSRSVKSQLALINESLGELVIDLKRRRRWNNTYIVLTGLNGRSSRTRKQETGGVNLHSDNTQVALFIKPALLKKRELGISWQVDRNVTLADVGKTLFHLLESESRDRRVAGNNTIDLSDALKTPAVSLDDNRKIIIESGWALWRGLGGVRYAIRQAQFLYIYDKNPQLYNVLGDRDETHPLSFSDPVGQDVKQGFDRYFEAMGWERWEPLPPLLVSKLKLSQDLWRAESVSADDYQELSHLSFLRPWDTQVQGWRAIFALKELNWETLETLGKTNQEVIWEYVGRRHRSDELPKLKPRNLCGQTFINFNLNQVKNKNSEVCKDKLFLQLLSWIGARNRDKKFRFRESFMRMYLRNRTDQRISQLNYLNGLPWHVAIDSLTGPLMTDLFLALPRYRKYQKILKIRKQSWELRRTL